MCSVSAEYMGIRQLCAREDFGLCGPRGPRSVSVTKTISCSLTPILSPSGQQNPWFSAKHRDFEGRQYFPASVVAGCGQLPGQALGPAGRRAAVSRM